MLAKGNQETALNSGLRVLDLSRTIGGAFCAKLMASLGAEVIRIGRPRIGDSVRHDGPHQDEGLQVADSVLSLYLHTGKKDVTLDLHRPEARPLFLQLAGKADVVVEDWGPGSLDRIGIGFDALHAINRRLVFISVSPFGLEGEYAHLESSSITVHATSGQMYLNGSPEREPLTLGGNPLQYLAGLNAFVGGMIALYASSEQHCQVDVAELESTAYLDLRALEALQLSGVVPTRREASQFLPCKDGWVFIQPFPHEWARFISTIGMKRVAEDERFATRQLREKHAQELSELLIEWTMAHTKEEIYHQLQQARISCASLATMQDLLSSPQYAARKYFEEIDHPSVGQHRLPGVPFKLGAVRPATRRAPLPGEHNQEILCGVLGLQAQELAGLREKGVI